MPLSDDRRVVALSLKVSCDGRLVFDNQAGFESLHDTVLQSGTPAIATGHDAIACWSANGRTGVCVGKDHAFGSQSVDARRWDFSSLWIKALHIAVAQIVAHHVNNVGFFLRLSKGLSLIHI